MRQMTHEQQYAVSFRDGALLLLAGPGSGKTFVLTHRIRALIDSGVRPTDILVITFTKAAAAEMKERFLALMYPEEPAVSFGTFHAIFYSIIRHHHLYRRVVPITDKDKINMIKRALEISGCEDRCEDFDDLVSLLGLISACKNNVNDPLCFMQEMYDREEFAAIFSAYNSLLHDFGLIDFDDMINICLDVLGKDSDFRAVWQKKFKYILIDEFQDISGNQYELVKLLASPEYNVFAVGDDDQSIYAFRGADVSLMKRFTAEIPNARTAYLSVNYRCSGNIVDFAGRVIRKNRDRFDKDIRAVRDAGNKVSLLGASDLNDQNEAVIRCIRGALSRGIAPEEIAILLRTNRQAGNYAALLRSKNIPCNVNEQRVPYSSVYIKDICAYMAISSGENLREHFLRIVNKPVRYIKRAAMPSERVTKQGLLAYYRDDKHMTERIEGLFRHLNRIRSMRPHLALRYICNTIGYNRYVKEEISPDAYLEYLEQISSFGVLIKDCDSYKDVRDLLESIQLSFAGHKGAQNEPGVRIQTYHSSKGLEYDTVILPDINEGKTPSKSAHTPAETEEERRMFYVAMTRAQNDLHILYRTDENLKPGRFIADMIEEN